MILSHSLLTEIRSDEIFACLNKQCTGVISIKFSFLSYFSPFFLPSFQQFLHLKRRINRKKLPCSSVFSKLCLRLPLSLIWPCEGRMQPLTPNMPSFQTFSCLCSSYLVSDSFSRCQFLRRNLRAPSSRLHGEKCVVKFATVKKKYHCTNENFFEQITNQFTCRFGIFPKR